jgi:hypothetical protein
MGSQYGRLTQLARLAILLLFPVVLIAESAKAQTSATPRVTDLFSVEEFRKAGLLKLSPQEMDALNAAFFRVLVEMNSKSASSPESDETKDSDSGELDFYDSRGKAVAYVAEESDFVMYLWTGEPVAYLDDENVYGFNGKHLGWFKNGKIYDHEGSVVAALADRFTGPVSIPPLKSLRELVPLKSLKELEPLQPLWGATWSDTPARLFFLEGVAQP